MTHCRGLAPPPGRPRGRHSYRALFKGFPEKRLIHGEVRTKRAINTVAAYVQGLLLGPPTGFSLHAGVIPDLRGNLIGLLLLDHWAFPHPLARCVDEALDRATWVGVYITGAGPCTILPAAQPIGAGVQLVAHVGVDPIAGGPLEDVGYGGVWT